MAKTAVTLPSEKGAKNDEGRSVRGGVPEGIQAEKARKEEQGSQASETTATGSPFAKASEQETRLKLFLWGPSGSGKTKLAIQFPKAALIDMERGSVHYPGEHHVIQTTNPDEVMTSLEWLASGKHDFRTVVIDPVTIYWEALQRKWSDIFMRRKKGFKGHRIEFYDMQAKDWLTVKSDWKRFVDRLISIDMNVVVTAHQKSQYRDGDMSQVIGQTYSAEKTLDYFFDTVVQTNVSADGKFVSRCVKDRTGNIPANSDFPTDYAVFEKAWGKKSLGRKVKAPPPKATDEQIAKLVEWFSQLELTADQITAGLSKNGVQSMDAMTQDQANKILLSLKEKAKPKKKEVQANAES